MRHELRYESALSDGRTWVYRLQGDLYGTAGGYAFQEDVSKKIASGPKRVIVDLSAVERIDSSGVGILVAIMWSASRAGGGLVVAGLTPRVEKVLGLALLLDHIARAPSVEEAMVKLDAMGIGPT
jgi:anti-sigma B factor antagonist